MSLWTVLSKSEREIFHDILLADGWSVARPVFSFSDGAPEPAYIMDNQVYGFSAAVEGGEAVYYGPAARGASFALAGGIVIAGLIMFWLMEGK